MNKNAVSGFLSKILLIASILLLVAGIGHGDRPRSGKSVLSTAYPESMVLNGDDNIRISKGYLRFNPRPDIYICFCGEYYLYAEKPHQSFYLKSDSIDLSEYIDKEILVVGRAFTRICDGTLAMPCDFMDLIEVAPAGSAEVSWGFLKRIYRQ